MLKQSQKILESKGYRWITTALIPSEVICLATFAPSAFSQTTQPQNKEMM
jgi:hypothetical protein